MSPTSTIPRYPAGGVELYCGLRPRGKFFTIMFDEVAFTPELTIKEPTYRMKSTPSEGLKFSASVAIPSVL